MLSSSGWRMGHVEQTHMLVVALPEEVSLDADLLNRLT